MPREVLVDQVVEVLPVADPLPAPLAAEPFPARLAALPAEHQARQVLQPLPHGIPLLRRPPANQRVHVGRLGGHAVKPPVSSCTGVERDPHEHTLMEAAKSHGLLPRVLAVVPGEALVRRLQPFSLLDEPSGVVRVPGSVGVEGEEVDGHAPVARGWECSGVSCCEPPASAGGYGGI